MKENPNNGLAVEFDLPDRAFRYEARYRPEEPFQPVEAVDLHLHTSPDSSDIPRLGDRTAPTQYYRAIDGRQMSYFTKSDHNRMGIRKLLAALGRKHWPRIIPNAEYSINDPRIGFEIHVLALKPHEILEAYENRWPLDRLVQVLENHEEELKRASSSIDDFTKYAREHKLTTVLAHAGGCEVKDIDEKKVDHRRLIDYADRVDLIELCGAPSTIQNKNMFPLELALLHDKPLVAGSDSHSGDVGRVYTLAPGDNPVTYLENIKAGLGIPMIRGVDYEGLIGSKANNNGDDGEMNYIQFLKIIKELPIEEAIRHQGDFLTEELIRGIDRYFYEENRWYKPIIDFEVLDRFGHKRLAGMIRNIARSKRRIWNNPLATYLKKALAKNVIIRYGGYSYLKKVRPIEDELMVLVEELEQQIMADPEKRDKLWPESFPEVRRVYD
ncbi:MAG: hypothetical protein KJ709_06480 [Nanoarchaeota archaeon]|nr:hypothetical protein [Nanoarchaeota archaeon]